MFQFYLRVLIYCSQIVWTVEIEKTKQIYTGGFNTTMVFHYDSPSLQWSLIYWHELWSNVQNLTTCGSSEYVSQQSCIPAPSAEAPDKPEKKVEEKKATRASLPTRAPVANRLIGKGKVRRLGLVPDSGNASAPSLNLVTTVKKQQRVKVSKPSTNGGLGGGGEEEETDSPTAMPTSRPTFKNETFSPTSIPTSSPTEAEVNETESGGLSGLSLNDLKKKTREKHSISISKVVNGVLVNGGVNGEEEETTSSPTSVPTHSPTLGKNQTHIPTAHPTAHPTASPTADEDADVDASLNGLNEIKAVIQKRKKEKESNLKDLGGDGEEEEEPTSFPTAIPSFEPTVKNWTHVPTTHPTSVPTSVPVVDNDMDANGVSDKKSKSSNKKKVSTPSLPEVGEEGTPTPSAVPTAFPSATPTSIPTAVPSAVPSSVPTLFPTKKNDTNSPTSTPTSLPTSMPTAVPTSIPTVVPTELPTAQPKSGLPQKKVVFERPKSKPVKVEESASSVDLTVTMYDSSGKGWYKPDYTGTSFYISDDSKTELIAYGTLENGTYSGYCEYCFGEGSFYFRVSANKQRDARWSFCHTNGSYSEQLSFHIEDGVCVPDALLTLEQICDKSYSSVVTVSGVLSVSGIPSEMFDKKNNPVLAEALASVVDGWDEENIGIVSAELNVRSMSKSRGSLSPLTYDITFEVSFVPEIAFEFDGLSYDGVEDLVESLKEELTESAQSGDLTSAIKSIAQEYNVKQLTRVSIAELVSLSLSDITYVGTTPFVVSEETELSSSFSSPEVSSSVEVQFSMFHVLFFGTVLSVGFVAFVGVLVHTFRPRGGDSVSKYVTPSEIDLSVSNHFNDFTNQRSSVTL